MVVVDRAPGENFYPVQVKQKDKASRPDVDSFEAMMMRDNCRKEFFVSFDYTGDARTEISRVFEQSGRVIISLAVQEILGEETAHKLAQPGVFCSTGPALAWYLVVRTR